VQALIDCGAEYGLAHHHGTFQLKQSMRRWLHSRTLCGPLEFHPSASARYGLGRRGNCNLGADDATIVPNDHTGPRGSRGAVDLAAVEAAVAAAVAAA